MRLAALFALATMHATLLVVGAWGDFVVVDEAGHIPSGLSHWRTGTFSAYRVNPPLARMLATVPALTLPVVRTLPEPDPRPGRRPEWDLAEAFFANPGAETIRAVRLARLPGIALSVLGLALARRWAREIYGEAAGWLAAVVWCFDPMILAFGRIVTPDMPAAVAALGATYAFRKSMGAKSWGPTVLAGVALGLAQLSKFTLLTLYLAWPILAFLWWSRCQGRPPRASRGVVIVLASLLVINLGYGFSGTFRRLGSFEFASASLAGREAAPDGRGGLEPLGNRFSGGWLAALPVPLPADFLAGIDLQRRDFEVGMPAYLGGRWQMGGWYDYYLYGLLVKVPVGTLILVAWAVCAAIVSPAPVGRPPEAIFVWLPALIILAAASSQTGINQHLRYVLPAFPFAIVGLTRVVQLGGRPRALAFALATWSACSSLAAYPFSMSYFNEAAGGPAHGAEHLVDSNIDWGQDLLRLRDWSLAHPEAAPLGLAFNNFLDPRRFGIEFRLPPIGPDGRDLDDARDAARFGPRPGWFAISVNLLHGMTGRIPDGLGGYRDVSRRDAFTYFDRLRPRDRVGYSLWIYQIDRVEADALRREMGLPPLPGSLPEPAQPGE